jgi:hypothetical protein
VTGCGGVNAYQMWVKYKPLHIPGWAKSLNVMHNTFNLRDTDVVMCII